MDDERRFVVPYLVLRQMIGATGLLMPLLVRLGAYLEQGIASTDSISAYYYTGMRDYFVSTLVLVGALLACYRTPAVSDNVLAVVAGLASIGIGLFPMDPDWAPQMRGAHPELFKGACFVDPRMLGYHAWFAALFFALSFYMVYFRFAAFTPPQPTPQKRLRNRIYRGAGMAMLCAFIAIGALAIFNRGASIFWPETVAVVAFGVAWLVKGQAVLRDR